jgi:hypothetical protein
MTDSWTAALKEEPKRKTTQGSARISQEAEGMKWKGQSLSVILYRKKQTMQNRQTA